MLPAAPALPIDPILPDLAAALGRRGLAVLEAPPGAGKTTRVPLCLLDLVPGRILMREPRRVAARAAADRLASSLGEAPGGRVGYRMRGEAQPGSRIEVVTEGILTRLLQAEPDLPGIGCIIFDEFHERSLQADLGLALALEARAALRPDLRLVVMSATLDAAPVAALLGAAPRLTAQGRAFPVETRWLERPQGEARVEAAAADLILEALAGTEGGLLAFLPGQAEIARTAARLAPRLPAGTVLQPLHGGLPLAAQRAALAPSGPGARKLVLATAIAETSLTIPDVRVVVDAGLARRARFDPGSGMSRLVTERVTRAEAEQRRGRAGRTAPGWCFRLWTKGEEGALAAFPPPEIASADLTRLALELALWGSPDGSGLAFLTPPPAPALAEARGLLADLGALDARGQVTAHGRALAALPLHPRLAHMLATEPSQLAADLAALLEARDPLRGTAGRAPSDLGLRLLALRDPDRTESEAPVRVDRGAIAALRSEGRRLMPRRTADRDPGSGPDLSPGAVLSLAYPDRIARRREGSAPRFLLTGGKGAHLDPADPLAGAPFLVAADLDGDPREARIRRALPVTEADLRSLHADRLREERVVDWSRRDRAVIARERLMLGAVALEDRPWRGAPPEALAAALAAGVRDLGLAVLPWTEAARRFQSRVAFLRSRGEADLPDLGEAALTEGLEDWLAPHLTGLRRIDDLARIDLGAILAGRLDPGARARLDRLAPAAITAPTGTRLAIDYGGPQPSVAVRLQEMFGTTTHPTAAGVPLLFELLSPAGRPVQTTADLPGFWRTSYADVRRDLRGRYPRHPWPEDPAAAAPTRRVKPRGT